MPERAVPATTENGGRAAMSTGAELIAAERQRQVEAERWSSEHDDEHDDGALVAAAECYLDTDRNDGSVQVWDRVVGREEVLNARWIPRRWPWHPGWWKPTPDDRIRELVKAGALIAAEIDRLQRLDSGQAITPPETDQNGRSTDA